jgi:hypothetical protein
MINFMNKRAIFLQLTATDPARLKIETETARHIHNCKTETYSNQTQKNWSETSSPQNTTFNKYNSWANTNSPRQTTVYCGIVIFL